MSHKPFRFSRSMKRATISFTIPGEGRTTVQENEGIESDELRHAIKEARKTFWMFYKKIDVTKGSKANDVTL